MASAGDQGLKRQEPRRRIYKPTDCILTSNVESGNVYAVGLFNVVTIHALVLPLAILLKDSYSAGRLFIDPHGYFLAFGAPWEWLIVAVILFLEFVLAFIIYFCFLFWAACYRRVGRTATVLFFLLFVVCAIASRRIVFTAVFDLELHPVGRLICWVQQLVFFMKWVSFIHENGYKVLHPWHKDDETGPAVWYAGQMEPQIGSFSSYVYFLFCPVLLYRDRYPRKPANFWKAFLYSIQFVAANLVGFVIVKDFLKPQSLHLDDLLATFLRCVFLGYIVLSTAHVVLMNAWMNMWAEMLGFADCGFYQDWWNCCSLPEYLSKWNPVIQEWLKENIHIHLKKWLPRVFAVLAILLLSALEHDIFISIGLGFFMPMYLVEYGIGGMLLSLKPPLGRWTDQMIMCFVLSVGSGIQLFLYHTEYAARTHCPVQNASWFDGLQMIDCYRQLN